MKLFFAATVTLSLLFSGLFGLNKAPHPTVTSIHAFEEPLVAIGGDRSSNQDSALIAALQTYQKRKSYEDVSAITTYLDANPQSPWKFSLLANLGIVYRKTGHFSRAVDTWERAWSLGKGEKNIQAQTLANQVAGDLAALLSSLGRTERLASLLQETKGRNVYGSAGVKLVYMKQNLWLMRNKPGDSFKCGPYALDSIRTFKNPADAYSKPIRDAKSTAKGFSLTGVRDLSNSLKMNYQMAKRQPGAELITPSVVHWKSGHYAALLKKVGDNYLTKDPTFVQESLVTTAALEEESSGYFLVPNGPLPTGWQPVSNDEGNTVFGRGQASAHDASATGPNNLKAPSGPCPSGMPVYSIFAMLACLSIDDMPVGYTPPVGPDAHFKITYNQLEANQPGTFQFFNFGPSWNCNWLSYVTPATTLGGTAYVNTRGGGQETYSSFNETVPTGYVGYYDVPQLQGQATLWETDSTPPTYERRLPNGSKEIFGKVESGVGVLLTAIIDPQGNSITFTYDSSYRLTTVTDALELQTTLSYGLSGDPLKVTQITDPYGRSASFTYTTSAPYQLVSITDVINMTSSFTYGSGSVISQMTTPYGTTAFTSSSGSGSHPTQSLAVTEPDGSQVYAEARLDGSNYPYSTSESLVPTGYGLNLYNSEMEYQNTYFWDKKAMHDMGGTLDYTKAHIYHWLLMGSGYASPVLHSEKPALENRIWYNYPYQAVGEIVGTTSNPTIVARVIGSSGSTTQATQYQYYYARNPAAITVMIDPAGRQTNYTYDTTTGIDLMGVTQSTGTTTTDTLFSASYDSYHRPLTVTDAAGQITTYTYNAQEQITSVTPPTRSGHSAETTTYGYTSNFLTSITGPLSGAVTTITPDTDPVSGHTMNRIKSISDAESYTRNYSYDNLDRVTQILYPDSTTETFSYLNPITSAVDLDLHSSTDRLNHTTTRTYDSVRHLTSITDPLSRTTSYGWCSCGSMTSLTDAKGNITYFNRDVESRLTSKIYPGETQPPSTPDYTYDTAGRVSTYKDKRGDVATYSYNLDNTVSGISYSLGTGAAPPTLSYGYDTYYPRLTSSGGVGLTYYPAGSLGAGKPETITNTLTGGSAAVTTTYDEWGRKVGSNIDSSNPQSVVFDSLGRVTNALNLLAPTTPGFAYSYYDPTHPTNRIGSISYPNGQSTSYSYFGSYNSFTSTGDENLSEIKNLTPSSTVLSQDDYTCDAMGKILTWQQQTHGNTPVLWTEGYDAADQLTSAVQTNTAISSPAVRSDSYGYDAAGNATTFNVSGVSRSPSYNALNQLTGSTPTGNRTVGFTGLLNEASTITVNGSAATVNSSHYFSGTASLTPGSTSTVSVVATDSSGNTRTNHYQTVVPAEPTYSPTFDNDGNELTNGAGQTYTWDALNELASITYTGGASTVFTYDALGRRIGIVEKNSGGTVTSTKQLVWDGSQIAEERDASNSVTKRFYAQGEQISGTSYYYTFDHLGSVREMCDSSGNIQARYDYDPYGRATLVSGSLASDFQYAGYYEHPASGLNFTKYRAYDPNTARWLSRDPYKDRDGNDVETILGPNLYEYVRNSPIDRIDPLGLAGTDFDNTYFGSFSLFNLFNGNAEQYLLETLGLGGLKKGALMAAKKVCPNAAGAANELTVPAGTLLSLLATAMDVPGTFAQQATPNLPVNDPTDAPGSGVDMGGGISMQEDYPH